MRENEWRLCAATAWRGFGVINASVMRPAIALLRPTAGSPNFDAIGPREKRERCSTRLPEPSLKD